MIINNGAVDFSDYYRILFNNISIGIQIMQLLYNDQGEPIDCLFLDVNPIFTEIIGLAREEIIGKKVSDLISDIEPERLIKYEKAVKMKKADKFEMFVEFLERWFEVFVVPLEDQDKFGILCTDITKHKKAEELRESKKKALKLVSELKKADENKNEFINILSHELRNPLTTIMAGVQLLELTNKDRENLEMICTIKRQARHLIKLVDDLLSIIRIVQKKVTLNRRNINLKTVVKNVIEDIKPQFEEKGIRLLEDICTESAIVNADSLRITQCIGNVLSNALKFTGKNGTVNISLRIEDKKAIISVIDNGMGISSEALPNIFEAFKQDCNSSDKFYNKGLGLGLSIVKDFIEMHGGDITAGSPGLDRGSTFIMRLPIAG